MPHVVRNAEPATGQLNIKLVAGFAAHFLRIGSWPMLELAMELLPVTREGTKMRRSPPNARMTHVSSSPSSISRFSTAKKQCTSGQVVLFAEALCFTPSTRIHTCTNYPRASQQPALTCCLIGGRGEEVEEAAREVAEVQEDDKKLQDAEQRHHGVQVILQARA